MSFLILLVRLALAAVFAVAGVSKLLDRRGTIEAVEAFGVPRRFGPAGAILVPVLEISTVVLFLVGPLSWWGGILGLALLAGFCVAIIVNLAQGRTPDCHCFGQIHSEPIGWPTLARNAILAVATSFVLAGGRDVHDDAAVRWIVQLSALQRTALVLGVLGVAMLAAQLWSLLRLSRENRLILQRLGAPALPAGETAAPGVAVEGRERGLPPGSPAPEFTAKNLQGEEVTLQSLLTLGRPLFLVFTDPICKACVVLKPHLAQWRRDFGSDVEIVVLSQGVGEEDEATGSDDLSIGLFLLPDRRIESAYGVDGTPTAVVVRSDGTVGSPLAEGAENIRWLFDRVLGMLRRPPDPLQSEIEALPVLNRDRPAPAYVPGIGDPAPEIQLLDRDGTVVDLADLRGKMTVLLFWRSNCGFCRSMQPEIEAWEAAPPIGAAGLIVVSLGDFEDARSAPFQSPVVVDPTGGAAAAFGVEGTPIGILLNEHGILVARTGGAGNVLDLLGATPRKALATHA